MIPANPKQMYGDKKPSLSMVPLSGQLAQWEAHQDGKLKYGLYNWLTNPVEIMTYVDAAQRHLQLFAHGEQFARDTNVQNLGAVMACCAIIIDAQMHGSVIDNRIFRPEVCDALHTRGEHMVKHLRKMQERRERKK